MKELLIAFVFALMIGSVINGCMQPNTTTEPSNKVSIAAPAASANIINASDASFGNDVLASSKPVLVDFWATWCGPCKHMEPIISGVATQYADKIKVVKVDVDTNQKLVDTYHVDAMPTFIVFKNGKQVDALVGAVPKDLLIAEVKKYID